MAAYVFVDVEITDHEMYEEYKKHTPAAVAAYGGKFLARGGNVDILEGDWQPGRIVILEFPDAGTARDWWESDLYSKAREIRQKAANTRMIIVEGV